MRKLLTSVAAIAVAGFAAYGVVKAANLPLVSGISNLDPAAEQAIINGLIQSINAGVTGNYGIVAGPVGNSQGNQVLTPQTLGTVIIPTGLIQPGQGFRARCGGQDAAAATQAKLAIRVNGGNSAVISIESATVANPWDMELVFMANTNPVTANYGFVGHGISAPATGSATNFISANAGQDVTPTDNNALFPLTVTCVVAAGAGGIPTGSVTMQSFLVEMLR